MYKDIWNRSIWKKEEERPARIEDYSGDIEELNLSVRSFNCLRRAGCQTVGDIMKSAIFDTSRLSKPKSWAMASAERNAATSAVTVRSSPAKSASMPSVCASAFFDSASVWDSWSSTAPTWSISTDCAATDAESALTAADIFANPSLTAGIVWVLSYSR